MGWSAKHGLRPNRPRPLRKPGTRKIIKRPPREPGYRVVGVLTVTNISVNALHSAHAGSRFMRCMTTREYRLHPTKGYRPEGERKNSIDFHTGKWPPSDWIRGRHIEKTFKRAAAHGEA